MESKSRWVKMKKNWQLEVSPDKKKMKRAGSLRVSPDEKWKGMPFESKPRFEKIRNIKKNEKDWPLEVSPDENKRNYR